MTRYRTEITLLSVLLAVCAIGLHLADFIGFGQAFYTVIGVVVFLSLFNAGCSHSHGSSHDDDDDTELPDHTGHRHVVDHSRDIHIGGLTIEFEQEASSSDADAYSDDSGSSGSDSWESA